MEWSYGLARVLAYPLRLAFRIPQQGFEQVPRNGPVILAANHVSFLDPLMILWLGERTHRKIRFLAMAELWQSRLLHFFLVHTKQIPVARESSLAGGSLANAARALRDGECVCIFPEGRLTGDGQMNPFRSGVEKIVARTPVPVVPMGLRGLWGSFFRRKDGAAMRRPFRRFWSRIDLMIGEPVPADAVRADALGQRVAALAALPAPALAPVTPALQ